MRASDHDSIRFCAAGAQQSGNPQEQLIVLERLGQEIPCSQRNSSLHILGLVSRRQDKDRPTRRVKLLKNAETVETGHIDIEDEGLRAAFMHPAKRLKSIASRRDRIPGQFQPCDKQLKHHRVVIDDQQARLYFPPPTLRMLLAGYPSAMTP